MMNDFTQWPVIGCGSERICYQNPRFPNRCLKVSRLVKSKQAFRESRYFKYLMEKGVSFRLIPDFYGVVVKGEFIGIEQELILDKTGSIPPTLGEYLNNELRDSQKKRFWSAVEDAKFYLTENNIIVCDLVLSNFLVVEDSEKTRLFIIDGLGASEFFPIVNYVPLLGKIKIARKWKKFLHKKIMPAYHQKNY